MARKNRDSSLTVTVQTPDLKELRADLESAALGLGREVSKVKRDAADEIAKAARPLTPRGPGPIAGRKNPSDALPHIADTIKGSARGVVSDHPAALVTEFGGTIRPRGSDIQIHAAHMAEKAGDAKVRDVERQMQQDVERLLSRIVE